MSAALCSVAQIKVRAMFGERVVRSWKFGDWAVHRQIDNPALWAITLMPHGLSLPFAWASFKSRSAAIGAMADIVRMRNGWAHVEQGDFNEALRRSLIAICSRHGAVDGGMQVGQRLDAPRFGFGMPMTQKLNEVAPWRG